MDVNSNNNATSLLFVVFLNILLLPLSAYAQSPGVVPVGPFDFRPSLTLEYAEDDNLFQSSSGQVDTAITVISPGFSLVFDNGVSGLQLEYGLENATFSRASQEDYTDQRIGLEAGTLFAGLHRIDVSALFSQSHDRLSSAGGSLTSIGTISDDSLDEFEDTSYDVSYTLGADRSLFNFLLSAGVFERIYKNNRFDDSQTPPIAITALSDREEEYYRVGLDWHALSNMTIGVYYRNTDIEYVITQPGRDGEEEVIAFSFDWSPIETFDLSLNLGKTDRSPDVGDNVEENYWNLELEWSPVNYSTLNLSTSSFIDESESVGADFSLREEYGVSWDHEWSDTVETEFSYLYTILNFDGSSSREDTNKQLSMSVSYQFRRWVALSLFFQNTDFSSSAVAEDFDQNLFGLRARFTL